MRLVFILFIITFFSFDASSQQMDLVTSLDNGLMETSGLIQLNGTLITHNDSGGAAALYEINATTGAIDRTVTITNATNVDWEDISLDANYIYVGDFGNNNGNRTDLKLYRVLISEYQNTMDDTVTADIINFSYADQTDFTSNSMNTNFDAEGLIIYNSSAYVFTKNWVDNQTNIYQIPIIPGTYSASKIDTISTNGLVTGATYNATSNIIVLTGYTIPQPFVVALQGFSGGVFSNGTIDRFNVSTPASYSIQVEAIAVLDASNYYLTAEESVFGNQGLFSLNLDNLLSIPSSENPEAIIYPNPTSNTLHIQVAHFSSVTIYSLDGRLLKRSDHSIVDVSDLSSGTYVVTILSNNGLRKVVKSLIIN